MYGTSYRSSIETIALNCLVFEKNRVFVRILATEETDRQTDGQPRYIKALPLSRAALNTIMCLATRKASAHRAGVGTYCND